MKNTPPHRNGKICVSVARPTTHETIETIRQIGNQADVIEIRLDALTEPTVAPFAGLTTAPLLFTNRAAWESGNWQGSEDDRIRLLTEAAPLASYLDIELKTERPLFAKILAAAQHHHSRVIVSWHSFADTPSAQALHSILQEQYRSGADIGKIVTMARDFNDVLRVLSLQTEAADMGFPLIAFCMGTAGMISRLATMGLNGFMTYVAPDDGAGTAPGQLPFSFVSHVRDRLSHAD